MKRVLLTGATGFVGRHVIAPLLARGYDVHVVSRRAFVPQQAGVHAHVADLLDCSAHRSLIEQVSPSHLLHGAWYAEHGKFWNALENVAWLKASLSLGEAFCAAGGERLLGVGTCAEYEWPDVPCVEGQTRECPSSLYGRSKLSAFHSLAALAQASGTRFAWARLFFPYGPDEPRTRLIPYVILSLLRGEIARCTHGRQLRDYLHVADIGEALAAMLDSPATGAINLGSGEGRAIGDIVQRIGALIGRPELIALGAIAEPEHSGQVVVADVRRLCQEVAWSPRHAIDDGLRDTIGWWQQALQTGSIQ